MCTTGVSIDMFIINPAQWESAIAHYNVEANLQCLSYHMKLRIYFLGLAVASWKNVTSWKYEDGTISFFSSRGKAVGFIKVGTKKLFLYDTQGVQKEVSPLCVLDFYVHESQQRKGFGKKLYEHMLQVGLTAYSSHKACDCLFINIIYQALRWSRPVATTKLPLF